MNIVLVCQVNYFTQILLLNPRASVPSPVLVATGTAQVGEGIVNSWGLDEDEEDEPLTEDRKTGTLCVRLVCFCAVE